MMSDDRFSDGTDKFLAHFGLPKTKRSINTIKKEYATARDAKKEQESRINPDDLKNYTEASNRVFDFFQELTGKPVNREMMVAHIHYYLDEGFFEEEMQDYIRSKLRDVYYLANPEKFGISNLFPIRDEERIKHVYEALAHFQALRLNPKKIAKVMIKAPCGHSISLADWKASPTCRECLFDGDKLSIIRDPYIAFPTLESDENRAFAFQFMRQGEENLDEYTKRTHPLRKAFLMSTK
jgi:hypothetical protein